jgi:succinate dehydrogenase/fumarate reductase iron-sulfur protein
VNEKWKVTFVISRRKGSRSRYFQSFTIEVDADEYVLDGIERIWAFHDRSLVFRHACHHSTCGACAMLVNGVERLTCITSIRSITRSGGTIKVEPLKNFPVTSDLAVDMGAFYLRMDQTDFYQVASLQDACLPYEKKTQTRPGEYERLVDCIECGMCVSACPAANTSSEYLGAGVLAAAQHRYAQTKEPFLLDFTDCSDGVWRCHSGFECSEVCPSNVDPAWRIMNLRKFIIKKRIEKFFKRVEKPKA